MLGLDLIDSVDEPKMELARYTEGSGRPNLNMSHEIFQSTWLVAAYKGFQ
jgi:hypothetical protein